MRLNVLALPGDGIGPEVTREAVRVLECVAKKFNHELSCREAPIGGAAFYKTGTGLPRETLDFALEADAILMGAVGLPEFDKLPPDRRPDRALLTLRKALGVYANLRPVRAWSAILDSSPLKNDRVRGADLMIVRELTGGLYYGAPRGIHRHGAKTRAVNTMRYTSAEIERVVRVAFEIAKNRRRKLASVDKSNVLETSKLWREVVTEVAVDFPDVELEHILVDNCAMQLVLNPRRFDVLVMENMFGDILSDEAAVLAGSIGMLPSASIGDRNPAGVLVGLYEPIHGSAPDIAGRDIADPLGAIGSVAAMLQYSFNLHREAAAVNQAIEAVLNSGRVTPDLKPAGLPATTTQVGDAVTAHIEQLAEVWRLPVAAA
jgi:3-isopropylmalate dehydrogenase